MTGTTGDQARKRNTLRACKPAGVRGGGHCLPATVWGRGVLCESGRYGRMQTPEGENGHSSSLDCLRGSMEYPRQALQDKAQDQDHPHQFSPSSQSKRHFQAPTASPRPIPPEPTSCRAMPCTASLSMLPSAYMLGSACYATCHPTCIPLGPETTSFPWGPSSPKSNSPTRTQHHEHHQTALISHAV